LHRCGGSATFAGVSAPEPRHLLVVCTANVCRSPMAARLLEHALQAEGAPWSEIPVISAGVAALEGEGVTPYSARALKKVGLELDGHRSRRVTRAMMEGALAVLGMTDSHRETLRYLYPEYSGAVRLFREFLPPGSESQIPDPYGMDYEAYEASRDSMVEAIPELVRWIKTLDKGS